jgi:hypothetical protein
MLCPPETVLRKLTIGSTSSNDIAMREEHAFGRTCRAGGVHYASEIRGGRRIGGNGMEFSQLYEFVIGEDREMFVCGFEFSEVIDGRFSVVDDELEIRCCLYWNKERGYQLRIQKDCFCASLFKGVSKAFFA